MKLNDGDLKSKMDTHDVIKIDYVCDCTYHKYICIGHPLGYIPKEPEFSCLMDIGTYQIEISHAEFWVWSEILEKRETNKENSEIVALLLNKKCLVETQNCMGMDLISDCVPYRQGFGCIHNKKQAIVNGSVPVYVPDIYLNIWRASNGINTVKEITRALGLEINDMINHLIYLQMVGTMYIKSF